EGLGVSSLDELVELPGQVGQRAEERRDDGDAVHRRERSGSLSSGHGSRVAGRRTRGHRGRPVVDVLTAPASENIARPCVGRSLSSRAARSSPRRSSRGLPRRRPSSPCTTTDPVALLDREPGAALSVLHVTGGPMHDGNGHERVTKTFPVFDCDAHINDPDTIWTEYLDPAQRDLVRQSYWKDDRQAVLNGRTITIGGGAYDFPGYNPICIAGPQMNKKVMRRLQQSPLTGEQRGYVEHRGAYDPHARLRDMDLMGIDQVMIIPTMMVANFPFVENVDAAYAFARAYNDWVSDFCSAAPDRLFPAGWLPLQSPEFTCREMERIAGLGFRVALIRPIDARGKYPNFIFPSMTTGSPTATMDRVFRTMEDTGLVLGM